MSTKRIFISADHGLAIIYFLQSDVVSDILNAGIEIVLLTDDGLKEHIQKTFGREGLLIEGLRLNRARDYFHRESHFTQWWLDFLRRAGASNKINLEAVDSYIHQVEGEAHQRRKIFFPVMKGVVGIMRRSRWARRIILNMQERYTPEIYADLFERYQPEMVIASTPGWRWDRYLLRESAARGIPNTTVIVGWDNTSSYSLPGAHVDWATCWSNIQKEELVLGSDWEPERVIIGGIPSYDGYFQKKWLMTKEVYYRLHRLDPDRKLISYACSFISFSPNIQNIEVLAQLIESGSLVKPSQLLVRLHPNHFMDVPRFAEEREQIRKLASEKTHVHLVDPVPLGGELGYYSGEDMPEKSSMMAYSDVFTTVYSTMVVEASAHGVPVVSVCIDSPVGWPGKFTLPLSEIGGWPTHSRFRESGAGKVALDEGQLRNSLNFYLQNPDSDREKRRQFIQDECIYIDGSAGHHTSANLLSLLGVERAQ